jgi:hypothetical protein
MADIRIKDLTTTASTTAADDFFAADGTTNGTRKLSAFSPTFGGNATVGGTLSTAGNPTFGTSGNTTLTLGPTGALYTHYIRSGTAGGAIQIQGDPSTGNRWLSLGRNDNVGVYVESLKVDSNGLITMPNTTASTTTSSGALVVGNGTSGGLGVGGAANVGGVVKGAQNTHSDVNVPAGLSAGFQVDVQAATTRDILTFGDSTRHGLIRGYQDGGGAINWRFGRYTASTFAEYVRIAGVAATDAVLSIYGTTASTSTSSGALVVSGGVGVAGAIYAGAAITSNYSSAANTGFSVINTNSAGSPGLYLEGDAGEYAIIRRGGSTYANPRALEYVATGSGAKHLFNTTAQFDGTVIAAASSNAFRITTAQTPASASATGTAGTIAWDTSYIYVCTATNTWKRAAISTW